MLILGIETSCDETAAAIVEDGLRVRSSVVASQHEIHAEYAGVVPELASRAHSERILPVVRRAIDDAGVTYADLGAIAVGHRPGLIGALLVGVSAAKSLAWSLGVPLVGVDHVHAHLYAGAMNRPEPVRFPAIGLVVSGGHTSLYVLDDWLNVRRLGATIDDAMGEAFDKAATILGLPHPGGPNLDRLARSAGANDRAVDLPVSRLGTDSLDFSFSGLKTALLYATRGVPQGREDTPKPPPLTDERKRDLAASFQRAAVGAVLMKLDRATEHLAQRGVRVFTLLTGGGVTANSRLRGEVEAWTKKRGLSLSLPPMEYCVDNAAMIAGLAHELHAAGRVSGLDLRAVPTTGL
ncbi:MAG: tRNA (adenosine(37)-N6)-threonylcarbamoyltransferase complex transferase subunit TsaD [Planctomycetota bacterium]|nr:tRNA (adenosine(37)-N6)-threonylcarbamoyltransferase complex transferase subunit TsaD [Planctomycetota bacterium]